MRNIAANLASIPREAPVMVLPQAALLPNTLLPLYIFEERYRQMLAHSLENHRMFCIAMMKPGVSEAFTTDDFFRVGGLGLVRASVARPDGTSHLVLQGLARVEFVKVVQDEPFRIARIEELKSGSPNVIEAEALAAKVRELCEQRKLPEKLRRELAHLSNPGVLADVVTAAFIDDPSVRQRMLEQPEPSERLRALIQFLRVE